MKDPFTCKDEMTVTLADGYRLFVLEMDDEARQPGGRGDGPTQEKLKTALFVETYLTWCKFQVMDIRTLLPDSYGEEVLKKSDDRDDRHRDTDARSVIAQHVTTFSLDTCLELGRKRAPLWFHKPAAALKEYMQTTQLAFGRAASSGDQDTAIIDGEIKKLQGLNLAVNRVQENRDNAKKFRHDLDRKRRPKLIYGLDPFGPERYEFPVLPLAYQMAHHSGVDPTDLWPRWHRFSPFFKVVVLVGLAARKQPFGAREKKDLAIVHREVFPYLDGHKLPEDDVTRSLLRLIAMESGAHDRFREKFGFEFAGPHGERV